jgi:multimeric flavodoxin WrbA
MAKVILLSGSPNAEGNTVQVLRECAKTIEANGVEAEVISLAGMKLHDAMDFKAATTASTPSLQKSRRPTA